MKTELKEEILIKLNNEGLIDTAYMDLAERDIKAVHRAVDLSLKKGRTEATKDFIKIIDEMLNRIRIHSDGRGDLEELKQKLKENEN